MTAVATTGGSRAPLSTRLARSCLVRPATFLQAHFPGGAPNPAVFQQCRGRWAGLGSRRKALLQVCLHREEPGQGRAE